MDKELTRKKTKNDNTGMKNVIKNFLMTVRIRWKIYTTRRFKKKKLSRDEWEPKLSQSQINEKRIYMGVKWRKEFAKNNADLQLETEKTKNKNTNCI